MRSIETPASNSKPAEPIRKASRGELATLLIFFGTWCAVQAWLAPVRSGAS